MSRSCGVVIREAFYYRTAKLVEIRNAKLGLLHHSIQFIIIAYVIGWVIIYKQGYQTESKMVPAFFTKVKGVASFDWNGSSVVMDAMDVVQPALEQNAVFLGMRFVAMSQRRGVCSGNSNSSGSDSELCSLGCQQGRATLNGIATGECDHATGFCFLDAWCPVEPADAELHPREVYGVRNFTVFMRANIEFPLFDITIDNVGKAPPVLFDPSVSDNSRASIWHVRDILALAGAAKMPHTGALIVAVFEYACDFNNGMNCLPQVSFRRLDDPDSNSTGFNYRTARFSESGDRRDFYKWWGVRLLLSATGQGRKFTSIVPAIQNFGAGVALVAVATLIADFLVEYVLPHRKRYKSSKILELDDPSDADDEERQLVDTTQDE